MTLADEVRSHAATNFVEPARARGSKEISIRAGDVHRALGYKNRYPLVCSALGAAIFETKYRVRRKAVEGPLNGSNTFFIFTILT